MAKNMKRTVADGAGSPSKKQCVVADVNKQDGVKNVAPDVPASSTGTSAIHDNVKLATGTSTIASGADITPAPESTVNGSTVNANPVPVTTNVVGSAERDVAAVVEVVGATNPSIVIVPAAITTSVEVVATLPVAKAVDVPAQVDTTDQTIRAPISTDVPGSTIAASVVSNPTAGSVAAEVDLGVANVAPAVRQRIIKGLDFADSKTATYAITCIPPSATWGGGAAKNFVIDYNTQTCLTVWVIGRLDFKSITSNGNLLTISVKSFRSSDSDASNLLARRLSQPQLRLAEAAYSNIRASYFKSLYGPMTPMDDKFHDATQGFDKVAMRKLNYEALKLGDIVMVEAIMKKYPCKANVQKTGSFGLSLEVEVVGLLHACTLQEHEVFCAEKESIAAKVGGGAIL